ncbi:MAG: AAA family ATPase [Candidatus Margulisiibacteriota bacterium]
MIRIGLIGSNGAGKSSACAFFREQGFVVVSLSDFVREEATRKNLPHSRDNLVATANLLKQARGEAVLAEMALAKMATVDQPMAFDSIRNVAEVELLKANGVYFIGIDAPVALRYERICKRGLAADAVTFDQFKAQDDRENEGQSSGQNIHAALRACNVVVDNTQGLDALASRLTQILKDVQSCQPH